MIPLLVTAVVLALAVAVVLGWFCLFRTNMIVMGARNQYEKSKFTRAWPLSGLVQKRWYPTYIRYAGVVLWLSTTIALTVLAAKHFR